ncbi:MAG: ABC transporter ATP-binding protein/permease, partial [Prochlorococcus sp.]
MTTTTRKDPFQGLPNQLAKFQRLAQPFFLPLDQAKGWQFIWLLISLVFCVGGLVLVALTGLITAFERLQPALTE